MAITIVIMYTFFGVQVMAMVCGYLLNFAVVHIYIHYHINGDVYLV